MKKMSQKKTAKTMNAMKPTDEKRNIWGYVNATGRQSEIINENGERIIETIHPYSFEETLKSGQDIKFRLNHEKPLGQRGQNLKLKEDNVGLYADGFVQDEETIGKIDRGEIAGWSLQFYDVPGGTSSWRDQQGIIHRDIYKLDLREVSLIDIDNVPAYTATSIHSRANGDGKRTIYNFISGYKPIHSRSIPMPQYMPQYASVPQYMTPYASVPQYMTPYTSVPQYMPQYMPQYVSVPQYMPQYASVPQYVVSMPSVEPRNPVVPGASFEVKTPDKENAGKGSEAKTEPAEAKEKPKAESKVEAEEKPKEEPKVETKEESKAESKVETKDEDNKNIDLSEIMKELSSDTNTIKKYYKNEV